MFPWLSWQPRHGSKSQGRARYTAFDCERDRTYISLIERGMTNPSLWALSTLAFALKTTIPDLLQGNTYVVRPSMGEQGRKRRVNQASHEAKPPAGGRRSQLR